MKTYTKSSLVILIAAIVAGLIAYISYINGTGFLGGLNTGFLTGMIALFILVPTGFIFSLIALKKEEKLLPGLMLFIFILPVIVFFGEPYVEVIIDNIAEKNNKKREIRDNITSEAYKIMAEKTPLWALVEPDKGYPVYLLDVALVNYNDTIEHKEYIFQMEELYVHATYNKLVKTNKEIPYSICKKRVSFTPIRRSDGKIEENYYNVKSYDISCTYYLYKNKSCTKIEDTNRKYKIPKDGHPYDVGIYANFFTYYARHRIEDSEMTLIYEDTK
jgi:Phosphotransferase system, fructose-specific IIC component